MAINFCPISEQFTKKTIQLCQMELPEVIKGLIEITQDEEKYREALRQEASRQTKVFKGILHRVYISHKLRR